MRLDSLKLYSFRNYKELFCEFHPGVNLITGENAQGKTNLLEAVTYLSTGKSFRTRKEQELIYFGDEFCEIQGAISNEEREQTLRAVLFSGRRPRQLYIGGVKQKNAALWKEQLKTVLFCPEDLMVLKTGASGRRKLLDDALCQLRVSYDTALEEYQKLLEHKSRILKDCREQPALLEPLPEFNEQLAKYGTVLVSTRAKYLRELEKQAAAYHASLSGGREQLTLQYQTVSSVEDPCGNRTEIYAQLRAHQESHLRAELESMQCLSGPHKDDFEVCLNGIPVKSFGSQGQTRTAAIALKLAERELFRQNMGSEPLLLLDDVLSELDEGRQNFILNEIHSGQVFITCCDESCITDIGKKITIANGALVNAEG